MQVSDSIDFSERRVALTRYACMINSTCIHLIIYLINRPLMGPAPFFWSQP